MYLGCKFLALETIVLLLNPGKEAPRRDAKNSILIWVLKSCLWYRTLSFAVRKIVKEFLKFKIISARYGHLNRLISLYGMPSTADARAFPKKLLLLTVWCRLIENFVLYQVVSKKKQMAVRKAS